MLEKKELALDFYFNLPLAFGERLHLVGLCLGRPLHNRNKLLVLSHDLLLFDLDLLASLNDIDLNLLRADLLLFFGALQLVGQLGLGSLFG